MSETLTQPLVVPVRQGGSFARRPQERLMSASANREAAGSTGATSGGFLSRRRLAAWPVVVGEGWPGWSFL